MSPAYEVRLDRPSTATVRQTLLRGPTVGLIGCAFGVAVLVILAACQTVGGRARSKNSVDFGPPVTLRMCLLKNQAVPQQRVDALVEAVRNEFGQYRIDVEVPWVRDWPRPGFTAAAIMADLVKRDLDPPCDRLVGIVDRGPADFLLSVAIPVALGGVDDETASHGYVVAGYGSLNQLVASPKSMMRYQLYHLIGCEKRDGAKTCHRQIQVFKSHVDQAADFVPSVTVDGRVFVSRKEVHDALEKRVRKDEAHSWSAPKRPNVPAPAGSSNER